MAISLRFAIGVSTALIVLVVAATSVTITTLMSTRAVRDVGERLAASVADGVTLQVEQFMAETQNHMLSLQNMSDIDGFALPKDRPLFDTPGVEHWGQPFMYVLRSMLFQADYGYSSVSMIFSDGSITAAFEHPRAQGWVTEAVQAWRNHSNGTGYPTLFQATYHTVTKRPWVDAEQGGPPPRAVYPVRIVTPSYWATEAAFGGETCMITPPRVDTNTFTPTTVTARYVAYSVCIAHNRSGYPVAQLHAGRYLDKIPDFLRGTSKTDNTQLFLGDSLGLLMAATTPESPIEIFLPEEKNHSLHSNCDTSAWTPLGGPERIGCRARVADYPYAPLQEAVAADPGFPQATRVVRNGKLAGERYFYISERVSMRPDEDFISNVMKSVGRHREIPPEPEDDNLPMAEEEEQEEEEDLPSQEAFRRARSATKKTSRPKTKASTKSTKRQTQASKRTRAKKSPGTKKAQPKEAARKKPARTDDKPPRQQRKTAKRKTPSPRTVAKAGRGAGKAAPPARRR